MTATVTSLPTVPTDRQRAAFRAYALDRMQVGPAAHTVHYATQALALGAGEDEVCAGLHRYLRTPWLGLRADAHILDVEIDAADASIDIERLADRVWADIRNTGIVTGVAIAASMQDGAV